MPLVLRFFLFFFVCVPKAKAAKEAADLEKAELSKLKDWWAYILYTMYDRLRYYV